MRRCGAAVTLVVLAACGGGGGHHPPTAGGVVTLVAGPGSRWTGVSVVTADRAEELTGDLRDGVVPLLASRAFAHPQPLAEYGLDHPVARLRFRSTTTGPVTEIVIGTTTFDRHGFYVQRTGDRRVFLVVADALRPALATVGIEIPPPV